MENQLTQTGFRCSVKGCNEKMDGWIDIFEDDEDKMSKNIERCGRYPFCKEHFDKIMPFIEKKEKEMQKENPNTFFVFVPLSFVNEALNK